MKDSQNEGCLGVDFHKHCVHSSQTAVVSSEINVPR
jgi:hypothetical protein